MIHSSFQQQVNITLSIRTNLQVKINSFFLTSQEVWALYANRIPGATQTPTPELEGQLNWEPLPPTSISKTKGTLALLKPHVHPLRPPQGLPWGLSTLRFGLPAAVRGLWASAWGTREEGVGYPWPSDAGLVAMQCPEGLWCRLALRGQNQTMIPLPTSPTIHPHVTPGCLFWTELYPLKIHMLKS